MLQFYPFTGTSGSQATEAGHDAGKKASAFVARARECVVTQVLQSESQSVSTWEGMNDWSYALTITLVVEVPEAMLDEIGDLYSEINL